MSLRTILDSGVAIINTVTKSLHSPVTFYRKTGGDGAGGRTFASGVTLLAAVDYTQREVRAPDGTMTMSSSHLIFVDKAALATATASAGIVAGDQVTLPNGHRHTVLNITGFLDPETEVPFATEAYLG